MHVLVHKNEPLGFMWDSDTYSCAYDSLFAILLRAFKATPDQWPKLANMENKYLAKFTHLFADIGTNHEDLEYSCDLIRGMLHEEDANAFPLDQTGTDVRELCYFVLMDKYTQMYRNVYCSKCKTEKESYKVQYADICYCSKLTWKNRVAKLGSRNNQPVSVWLKAILRSKSTRKCTKCNTLLDRIYVFETPSHFLPLSVENDLPIKLEHFTYMYGNRY